MCFHIAIQGNKNGWLHNLKKKNFLMALLFPSQYKIFSGMFCCFDQPGKKEKLLKSQVMIHSQGLTW